MQKKVKMVLTPDQRIFIVEHYFTEKSGKKVLELNVSLWMILHQTESSAERYIDSTIKTIDDLGLSIISIVFSELSMVFDSFYLSTNLPALSLLIHNILQKTVQRAH